MILFYKICGGESEAYSYFVYVTTASLWFYLNYKEFGANCYYFHRDRIYIHSRFSPIPTENIEYMKIVRHVYRREYFVISIKIKNKMLKHKWRLGIGGFIRGDNSVLQKRLIDDLNKRDIPYVMK
jgi:conserved domain protein